jgi:RNA polymerase sigma-70 factor (ECF subfamily)
MDTDDLVQETVFRAVKRIDRSSRARGRAAGLSQAGGRQPHPRRGAAQQTIAGSRRARRERSDRGASPLEVAIGAEALHCYEAALARLRPEEREAIIARVEMDGSYQEVAVALGKPSADAARMAVSRALLRLAEEMSREQV